MRNPKASKSKLSTTTILIEASNGATTSRGTGFMFAFKTLTADIAVPMLITNRHVLEGATEVKLRISTSDPKDPSKRVGIAEYVITSGLDKITIYHPEDKVDLAAIAMAPILNDLTARGINGFGTMFSEDDIITESELEGVDLADPILMVGYPIGLADYKHNLPIVRQGIIASDPTLPFDGEDHFLIDCACFPGSSGSPVVLQPTHTFTDESAGLRIAKRKSSIIGVLWGGPTRTEEGKIVVRNIPTTATPVAQVKQMINLGYVISAKKILNLKDFFLTAGEPGEIKFSFSHSSI